VLPEDLVSQQPQAKQDKDEGRVAAQSHSTRRGFIHWAYCISARGIEQGAIRGVPIRFRARALHRRDQPAPTSPGGADVGFELGERRIPTLGEGL